jgi:hypothetical protein
MRRFPRIHMVALPLLMAALIVAQANGQGGWYRAAAAGATAGAVARYGTPYGGYGGSYGWGPGYNYGEVIRAQGQYNKDTTEAMINYEDARSKWIDNKNKWTQAYHERVRMGQAAQAEKTQVRIANRDRYLRNRESNAPPRLGPQQLDPSTGKIYWPTALLDNSYDKPRKQLDELFVLRSHTGVSPEVSNTIRELSRSMQDDLKEQIRSIPPNSYLEARKFLESLAWEGQLPPAA